MEFSTTHDFPARLDRLWAAFGHPDYPRQKYLALGATAVRLDRFDADAHAIDVSLERVVPLAGARLPAWAVRLLGGEQTLRQRSTWRRVTAARVDAQLEIVPVGLPVRARGMGSIVEGPAGMSRMALNWRIDSSLPMMGGRMERLFAEQVRTALDEDHRFTLHFLQDDAARRGDGAPRRSREGARR